MKKITLLSLKFIFSLSLLTLICSTSASAARSAIENLTVTVTGSGTQRVLNFSVTDPVRGIVTGSTSPIDLITWNWEYGTLSWTYFYRRPDGFTGKAVGFTVYDPKLGTWRTSSSFSYGATEITSPTTLNRGGVISYFSSGGIAFLTYDPELSNWVYDFANDSPSSAATDSSGVVAWKPGGYAGLGATIYDPVRHAFMKGYTGTIGSGISYNIGDGTVNYAVGSSSGKFGYQQSPGPGITVIPYRLLISFRAELREIWH